VCFKIFNFVKQRSSKRVKLTLRIEFKILRLTKKQEDLKYQCVLMCNKNMKKNCCGENSKKIQTLKDLGGFLKIISNTNRLRILCLLTKKELCVCKIFEALDLSQNLTSHHLNKLEKFSLVEKRKEGTFVIYKVNQEKINKYRKLFNQIIKNNE
jgi:DNA-binding transcriptional ArsR family regulator